MRDIITIVFFLFKGELRGVDGMVLSTHDFFAFRKYQSPGFRGQSPDRFKRGVGRKSKSSPRFAYFCAKSRSR